MSQPYANPAFTSHALAIQIRILIADMHKHKMAALNIADLENILARLEGRRD